MNIIKRIYEVAKMAITGEKEVIKVSMNFRTGKMVTEVKIIGLLRESKETAETFCDAMDQMIENLRYECGVSKRTDK
ncbi:hypothetical protein M0R04_06525 [Candidatus Dojkabacteria bacterium]|jgi:hypothetical protein|nr:hypothetical protein [Candidatus Dojkabacteria bacterium]